MAGLLQFRYQSVMHHGGSDEGGGRNDDDIHTMTFADCMDTSRLSTPEEAIERYRDNQRNDENESLLLLGSGTSKVGEQLLMHSFVGPVLQMDICPKVIQLMTERYARYLAEASVKRMEFIVDDARGLTALTPNSIGGGVLDKGLIDVLHCSTGKITTDDDRIGADSDAGDTYQIQQIVDRVHGVLQPSRPFVFFSKSGPEYILRRALGTIDVDKGMKNKWSDIRVLNLVDLDVLLYRFVKAEPPRDAPEKRRINPMKKSLKSRGRRKQ